MKYNKDLVLNQLYARMRYLERIDFRVRKHLRNRAYKRVCWFKSKRAFLRNYEYTTIYAYQFVVLIGLRNRMRTAGNEISLSEGERLVLFGPL